MSFKIGENIFSTQTESITYYTTMRDRIEAEGDPANTSYDEIDALYRNHPEYSARVTNKAVLRYGVLRGKFQTPCFCVVFADGIVEDFSMRRCIESAAHK